MGWSVIQAGPTEPKYIASGVLEIPRNDKEPYQKYRARVIERSAHWYYQIAYKHEFYLLAYETIPVKGFRDMSQALLAGAGITAIHACAVVETVPVTQVAAPSVKARIAGSNRATKVGVRKGVQRFLPELDVPGWPQYPDESDAVAIGLTALGYKL